VSIPRCDIKDGYSDAHCIRRRGHSGRCWGRWEPCAERGTIERMEWISIGGLWFTSCPSRWFCPPNGEWFPAGGA
jgi:hypothetical protein